MHRLVLAIGVHPGKTPLFSADERAELLEGPAGRWPSGGPRARDRHLRRPRVDGGPPPRRDAVIRGLRDGTDLDYEMQMAGMNGTMAPEVQTVFLPASPGVRPITATLVRQIAAMGGDVAPFVPPRVAERLAARFRKA